ncbi:MAG: hydrogenase maturation protease [Leptospirillum sp. Group IV 'UBA BS']|nr:MAG: hydrogenase maturation protease [Leptospirillum sp. Group IV 'UBA BS']MCL5284384.1 hydrogenase maturation protease [Nitrospirota bacterium]
MTAQVDILGIGSPYHGDQTGQILVEGMRRDGFSPGLDNVRFVFRILDRPGWGLLEVLRETDHAILVDAMVSGRRPGSVCRLGLDELPCPPRPVTSHEVGLLPVLALGRSLGLLPPWMILYGIEITPPPFSDPEKPPLPSEEIAENLRRAIRRDLTSLLFPEPARLHPLNCRTEKDRGQAR